MIDMVYRLIDKYMGILEIKAPRPILRFRSNLGSKWLGICRWSSSLPETSVMELQKSILSHPLTLERVVAHEMIHHHDFMTMTPNDIQLIKLRLRPDGHGEKFAEGCKKINAIMGKDFVTKTSDQEYVTTKGNKEYFLLIEPGMGGDRLGWAWAARISPKAKEWVQKHIATYKARLIRTTDERWTGGAKIQRFGGFSFPKHGIMEEELLRDLYKNSPQVSI